MLSTLIFSVCEVKRMPLTILFRFNAMADVKLHIGFAVLLQRILLLTGGKSLKIRKQITFPIK